MQPDCRLTYELINNDTSEHMARGSKSASVFEAIGRGVMKAFLATALRLGLSSFTTAHAE